MRLRRTMIALLLLCGCSGGSASREVPSDAAAPDVASLPVRIPPDDGVPRAIILIADDYGSDILDVYGDQDGDGIPDVGQTYPSTPNISGLCRRGVQFDEAYSQPICSPTRAAILTGRQAVRTGIGWVAEGDVILGADEVTLPRALAAAPGPSIATANIGKWHLGTSAELGNASTPNTFGWDHYAGILTGALTDYGTWMRAADGERGTSMGYATSVNIDDAIAWLEQRESDEPWVLWVAFNAPHTPFHLPPAELHHQDGLSDDPDAIASDPAPYHHAMIEAMDTQIGRLMRWLGEHEMAATTIFLGDNGTHASVVNPPYRGSRAKGTLYEGGINVPLCVAGPSVTNGGRRSDALVHVMDIFPTVLELMGAPLPEGGALDAVSFRDVLGGAAGTREHVWVDRFGATETPDARMVRDRRYKLILTGDTEELFDLREDPLELENLIGQGDADADAAYQALRAYADGLPPLP